MEKVKIEKDIYVRDEFGVRRLAFKGGTSVSRHVYNSILSVDKVVNPQDLPDVPVVETNKLSVHSNIIESKPQVEILSSVSGVAVERERVDEEVGHAKAVEVTAQVAKNIAATVSPIAKEEVVAESEAEKAEDKAESEVEPKAKKSKKEGK